LTPGWNMDKRRRLAIFTAITFYISSAGKSREPSRTQKIDAWKIASRLDIAENSLLTYPARGAHGRPGIAGGGGSRW